MPLSPGGMVYQQLEYNPGLQTSGDLEPGTLSISGTSKPLVPTYSTTLTIPVAPDGIEVMRLAVFLQSTGFTLNGAATVLNFSLEQNNSEIGYGTFSNFISAFDSVDAPLTGPATYDLYLWPDADSIDVVEAIIDVGVGAVASGIWPSGKRVLRITKSGIVTPMAQVISRQGSGSDVHFYPTNDLLKVMDGAWLTEGYGGGALPSWTPYRGAPNVFVNPSYMWIGINATADQEIGYLDKLIMNFAS